MNKLDPKAIWLFFFRYLGGTLVMVMIFLVIAIPNIIAGVDEGSPIKIGHIVAYFLIAYLFYVIFAYIWARLAYKCWGYQLTDNSLKIEKGVIIKKYISIPYDRIQNVDIYRGVLTRLFGLSDFQVQTAGYSGTMTYRFSVLGGGVTEGRLPALNSQIAEQLREELIQKISVSKQGL